MKEIDLLEEQIAKLNSREFDFQSWKQYTILLLSRIFGEDDQKVKQISKLELDYSSWSLRDASGRSSQTDIIKRIGREILQAASDELKTFGIPVKKTKAEIGAINNVILTALENELKVSQFKELMALIRSDLNAEEKRAKIQIILSAYGTQITSNILSGILSDDRLKGQT